MDNIKRLFLEAWSLGEQNADNSHGGFGFWWDRNKSIIERELKQLNKPLVMQAEGSDVSEGAAVANGADGQSGSGGFYCITGECKKQCDHCYKKEY